MAKFSQFLVSLWIVSISQSTYGILSDQMLEDILNTKVKLHNSIITVRDLYGTEVTPNTFDADKFTGFLERSRGTIPHMDILKQQLPALPTTLLKTPLELYREDSRSSKILLLHGDPRTGKTTALRYINDYYQQNKPSDLTIYVDLQKAIKFSRGKVETLTIDKILDYSINKDFQDLIKNLAHVNPSKIRFLFDGIDQVPHAQEEIISLIQKFHQMKINMILTSSTDLIDVLKSKKIHSAISKIPSIMPNSELMEYTIKYWTYKTGLRGQEISTELIQEYAKIFRIMIQDTPLPRTFDMMEKMANRFLDSSKIEPFVDVYEYSKAVGRYYDPIDVIKKADLIHFPKMQFYNDFFQQLNPIMDVYGAYALSMMLDSSSPLIKAELKRELQQAKHLLTLHGENAFKFLIFNEKKPVRFVHREFKRYFAAKFVMDSFATKLPLIQSFKALISDPEHVFVLEFIDSAIKDFPHADRIIKSILEGGISEEVLKFTDYLIEYKLDNLCSKIFESMSSESLKSYLNQAHTLESKNKYSFGMLAEPDNRLARDYVPRKTRFMYSGTRPEMILNLEMKTTQNVWTSKGYVPDPNMELVYYAKQGEEPFEEFIKLHGETFAVDAMNKAMYEALCASGEDALNIMDKLQKMGAVAADINVNGRTLLHASVQWRSSLIVEAALDYFHVSNVDSVDATGRTIFLTALDANPFFAHTQTRFWDMMTYLLRHVDVSSNIELMLQNDVLSYSLKVNEMPRLFQVLMIANDGDEQKAAEEILERFVPLNDLDISPEILATRRNLVVKACYQEVLDQVKLSGEINRLTLTDILVRFRGGDRLNIDNACAYDEALGWSLINEGKLFTLEQRRRVFTNIAKNIIRESEMSRLRWTFQGGVLPKLQVSWAAEVYEILKQRGRVNGPVVDFGGNMERLILSSRSDMHPHVQDDLRNYEIQDLLFTADDGYFSDKDYVCDF